ncbi:MAG TPA: hypothetical protein VEA92_03545 [Candidatus Paceibacterota bacterium]|nr:hypothetical protein [Candidatus Paceibacterota bacterium]
MAVSPTIPTSFVPKQPLDAPRRKMQPGDNIFLLVSILILSVSVVTAGAVFGYQKYLESVIEVKTTALDQARSQIDREKVENFIRLQQRFDSGKRLLDNHVTASRFFTLLETVTLQNVRFEDLTLTVADDRTASVELSGTARNFNTLAAQSNEIATKREFKRAIFSDIRINTNGTVGFTLTADLDAGLMRMRVEGALATTTPVVPEVPEVVEEPVAAPAATTTAPAGTTTPNI